MSFLKLFLPALAIFGTVVAIGCDDTTVTIQNSGDAMQLKSCTNIKGDVVIADSFVGDVTIEGVTSISGSLRCSAENLTSLSAPSLATIGNAFDLRQVYRLAKLSFPALTSVNNISWTALPVLQKLNFGTPGVTQAKSLLIENTQLNSLDGISLITADTIDINNNQYLSSIDQQLMNITQSFKVDANSKSLKLNFPNLIWAANMTFRKCSSVNLPVLNVVNGSLGFLGNYFTTFSAPNLSTVALSSTGGGLTFSDNNALTNISCPALTEIGGGFLISNNTNLKAIDGFPKLKVVAGALQINGKISKYVVILASGSSSNKSSSASLSALEDVRGAFDFQTTETFDCSAFDNLKSSAVKGNYACSGNQASAATATGSTTGSATSSPTKPALAGRFSVQIPLVGIFSLVALTFSLLL
ncbi:MAG: hypothetical protein M1829_002586 [Trizodia sp. TS-e1964]|nr:MAG: hypothetical protein M1829_002586 [Trizodia sp. TS-e1964]